MSTSRVAEEAFEVEAPDVAFDESGPFREAGPLARREIVEDDDVLAVGEKGVREMGADETGAAGHEDGTRLGHHAAEDNVPSLRPLPASFYRRDTAVVARDLLGCRLIRRFPGGERRAVVIVETEAYLGAKDRAAHTWNGRRTPRVAPMWGPGGHAYVYFVYGMHFCLNVVTGREGVPEAVLLRAAVSEEWWRRGSGVNRQDAAALRCTFVGSADSLCLLSSPPVPRSSARTFKSRPRCPEPLSPVPS